MRKWYQNRLLWVAVVVVVIIAGVFVAMRVNAHSNPPPVITGQVTRGESRRGALQRGPAARRRYGADLWRGGHADTALT